QGSLHTGSERGWGGVLGAARIDRGRCQRRRHPGLHCRQAPVVASRELPRPDPYGAPVLYAYLTVRDPKAPGGARFVPELINNASGAGSQIMAVDMNKDGVVDVLTTGANGSFIFFGKARPGMRRTRTSSDARAPAVQR